jgi:formate-dependent nitrite reductase membrane component NrfD
VSSGQPPHTGTDGGGLEATGRPPDLAPHEEPPAAAADRETTWTGDHGPATRDTTPAVGTPGGPASWSRAAEGAGVALAGPRFGDAQWSYLFKSRDTEYAAAEPDPGEVAGANRRMREAPVPQIHGPFIKEPVWTWEVPLYFWFGGVASGAAFVATACDAAGDRRSARIARSVALGAVTPAPVLLIADLGRPARFLNMLRIFKPRSPMNMGAWCLATFSATAAGAVAADLLERRRTASGLGLVTALLGGYLGSYTGVLLAATAVPVWARSRLFLGPIFITTATATGAAATRLTLVARGLPARHPTRTALRTLETAAIVTELGLSTINERRLGPIGRPLRTGRSGNMFRVAESVVLAGMAAQIVAGRRASRAEDAASVLFLAGGLAFRVAWIYAGKASAGDHAAVAAMARGRSELESEVEVGSGPRSTSTHRRPLGAGPAGRLWGELTRRTSLAIERSLKR